MVKGLSQKSVVLLAIAVMVVFATPLANAQAGSPPRVTAWTDRPQYVAGEKGTMFIAFCNNRSGQIEVKNITLICRNWTAYIGGAWTGTETKVITAGVVASKETRVFDVAFNVPADGRGVSINAEIEVGTDHGLEPATVRISVIEPQRYMEQIVTLLTVLVVLVIVCTVIISSTIFLSARRPQVTWSKEERPQ